MKTSSHDSQHRPECDQSLAVSKYLMEIGVKPKFLTHPPCRSSAESRLARASAGEDVIGAKAIVLMVRRTAAKKREPWLAILPGDKRLEEKNIKSNDGSIKSIRFATDDELAFATGGLVPGTVPPLGKGFFPNITCVLLDDAFVRESTMSVGFNIGCHTQSAVLNASDLICIAKPNFVIPLTAPS